MRKEEDCDYDEGVTETDSPQFRQMMSEKEVHVNPLLGNKGSTHNGRLLFEYDFFSKIPEIRLESI